MKAETRTLDFDTRLGDEEYIVEGYATTFQPYELFTLDNERSVREVIHQAAFNGSDMSDVVMLVNHDGIPIARTSNESLQLSIDDRGLFIRADLSKTAQSKEIYDAIKSGLLRKMSWSFVPDYDDGRTFDRKEMTFHVNKIAEIRDVSVVTYPANENTEIFARSKELVLESEKREREKKQIELEIRLEMNR